MGIEKQISSFGILKIKKWKNTGKRKRNLAFRKTDFFFEKIGQESPENIFILKKTEKKKKKKLKWNKN